MCSTVVVGGCVCVCFFIIILLIYSSLFCLSQTVVPHLFSPIHWLSSYLALSLRFHSYWSVVVFLFCLFILLISFSVRFLRCILVSYIAFGCCCCVGSFSFLHSSLLLKKAVCSIVFIPISGFCFCCLSPIKICPMFPVITTMCCFVLMLPLWFFQFVWLLHMKCCQQLKRIECQ